MYGKKYCFVNIFQLGKASSGTCFFCEEEDTCIYLYGVWEKYIRVGPQSWNTCYIFCICTVVADYIKKTMRGKYENTDYKYHLGFSCSEIGCQLFMMDFSSSKKVFFSLKKLRYVLLVLERIFFRWCRGALRKFLSKINL